MVLSDVAMSVTKGVNHAERRIEDCIFWCQPGGCVQPYLEGFAIELISAGYATLPIRDYVRSASHLGRWLGSQSIGIERLDETAITGFARHKCQCPLASHRGRSPSSRYVKRARRFVSYLGRQGAVPPLTLPTPRVVPTQLEGFRTWMIRHRGVKARTVERHERLIEKMLPALGSDPSKYDAALVRQVLLQEINQLSLAYAKTYVTALRVFLRFLAARGRCQAYLDRAVPIVPEWKLSALPRYLETDDVERVIASCDLSKPHGVRDRAILLLLARLGLRGGDITAMRLQDLDWDAGTVSQVQRRWVCVDDGSRDLGIPSKRVCVRAPCIRHKVQVFNFKLGDWWIFERVGEAIPASGGQGVAIDV